MIRALALDIDDTILNQEGELSQATIQSVAEAKQAGLHVILATARGYRSTEPIHRQLRLTEPAVCHAGALVYDYGSNSPLHAWHIPRDLAQAVAELAEQVGATVSVYVGQEVWFNRTPGVPMRSDWLVKAGLPGLLAGVDSLETVFAGSEDISRVWPLLEQTGLLDKLTLTEVDVDGQPMLFLSRGNIDKATGLEWLLSQLGLSWEQVAACGDGSADICMIKRAAFGAAVPHASPEVLAASNVAWELSATDPVTSLIRHVLKHNQHC